MRKTDTLGTITFPSKPLAVRGPLAAVDWSGLVYPAALLLAFSLPFAAIPPLVRTPWLALSDDKLVFLLLVAAWLLQGTRAMPTRREWRVLLPSLVLVSVVLLSARAADADYANEGLR